MTPAPPLRLMLADDYPIIHHGLKDLLLSDSQFTVVGSAHSFAELLDQLAATPVDIILLDLGKMGAGPLVMVRELRAKYPAIKLVIFSSSVARASEFLRAGVLGYVVKEELLDHLPAAIRAAAAGTVYRSPLVVQHEKYIAALEDEVQLLPQEERVLELVAEAKTTQEISDTLAIKPRSVQNYITALFSKTGCEDRTQLAEWYRRHYGLPPHETGGWTM